MLYNKKEPKEDTRSVLGRRFDRLCGLFLLWLVNFLFVASLVEKLLTALMFSIPLLVLEAVALRIFLNIIGRKRQQQRRFWLAGKKFIEDISKINSRNEFILTVLELFAKIPEFQTLSLNTSRKCDDNDKEKGIDLIGIYQGVPVAILCMRTEGGNRINQSDIRTFAGALSHGGYKNGLFVTTGEYAPGLTRIIKEISRKGINIKLIDRSGMMNLALRAGLGGLQEKDATPGVSFPAVNDKRTIFILIWNSVFRFEKAKSYFLFGLMLYGGHLLMRGTSFLSLFYLSFALLNILMGAVCLYLGRNVVGNDPLKGFEPDKR
ncbi:MAG: hypothetical protein A4E52_00755 [Pelotomaculum sp. PtaB.Bin013]|uniref:Restriction endonuclease n=1 Tax=Pelotomaculum isophthalicicum JI TaxID=947010 RepID=A0A9X4JTR7_9FIRM|nr:restriction endonuclease [Pelotomaculum isophthalicicum]MDF9409189.1 restriction endonuclease [Pelotomaculum isophthalicicum JI]OPX90668.1 MAG: hypothetical protein A4E52_00755 [Pelotomaculum sp. PtaB.Bin013]